MKVLFLSLIDFYSLQDKNIYTDLLRQFVKNKHNVYAISPTEKRIKQMLLKDGNNTIIVKPYIGKIQKVNFIKKGISTICIEKIYVKTIKHFFSNIKFDLILYPTPPITIYKAVKYIKKRDNAISYLMLKDIFPQNSVDLGIIKKEGITSLLYYYFRLKEKKLYQISDYIGCMSEENVQYIRKHNQLKGNIHILPNCIEPDKKEKKESDCIKIKEYYNIPISKKVFVYGGNLGRPQGLSFLLEILDENKACEELCFMICGDGTEFEKLKAQIDKKQYKNVKLIKSLPKKDYENLLLCCDVGMIFLDNHFTIPNFPSRILSYMDKELPVIAATDINTDIGRVIEAGEFGFWCKHGDLDAFQKMLDRILSMDLKKLGKNAKKYLLEHYTAEKGYNIIIKHLGGDNEENCYE